MSAKSLEIELKFAVPEASVSRLRTRKIAAVKQKARATTQNLRSIYFDTSNLVFKNEGISFRVRQVGRAWIQTVKVGTALTGGLSKPREFEATVSGPNPDVQAIYDAKIRKRIEDLIGEATIAPVFETKIQRLTRVLTNDEQAEVEVAFDRGKVIAGDAEQDLSEIELELKIGDLETLYSLAAKVLSDEPWRFSSMSKAAQGYQLAQQEAPPATQPEKAGKIVLTNQDSTEQALQTIFRSCLRQITHNAYATLDSDDPEGPHQLRVGLRRLRSALKLFKSLLDPEIASHLNAEARDIAAVAGDLRDLDVLIEDIIEPCRPHAPSSIDLEALVDTVEKRRSVAQNNIRELLSGVRFRRFLLTLGSYTETKGWRRSASTDQKRNLAAPIGGLAKTALSKCWKRVAKHARMLEELSIEERHTMRKDLKKLRYAIEFFLPLYNKSDAKPFLKKLRSLQDMFGYLNDVAMAEKIPELIEPRSSKRSARERAAGFVLGWHQAQATISWGQATMLWQDTAAEKKFWKAKR